MNALDLSQLNSTISNYPNINWMLLAMAQNYYNELGYKYCEVPYLVPEEYNILTKPHNDQSFVLKHDLFENQPHELVGSAEQGFIYLMATNQLPGNKLCAITPCFRTERYSNIHLPWFMKCELFHLSSSKEDCKSMIDDAWNFFSKYTANKNLVVVQTSEESWDINLNNIEIGSFGLRHFEFGTFIYGTGLALPRFEETKKYE
jgi:hypothetical protein